jgi:hypothetical protein
MFQAKQCIIDMNDAHALWNASANVVAKHLGVTTVAAEGTPVMEATNL